MKLAEIVVSNFRELMDKIQIKSPTFINKGDEIKTTFYPGSYIVEDINNNGTIKLRNKLLDRVPGAFYKVSN